MALSIVKIIGAEHLSHVPLVQVMLQVYFFKKSRKN